MIIILTMTNLPTHLVQKHVDEAKALLSLELDLRKKLAEIDRKRPFYQKEFKYLEKLIHIDANGTQTFIPDLSNEHLVNITRYHAERNQSISSVPAKYLDEIKNR